MSNLVITRIPEFLDPWFVEIEQIWDELEAAINDNDSRITTLESTLSAGIVTSLSKSGSGLLTGAVTLTGAGDTTLTQVGNDIEISSTSITDHGALSGLADDDHTQYLKADGTRNLTGNLAVAALATIDGRDISVDGATLDSTVSSLTSHLDGLSNKHDASEIDVEGTYVNSPSSPSDLETVLSDYDTAISNAGLVSSVFGRTGAVVAVSGDYTASDIDVQGTYSNAPSSPVDLETVISELNTAIDNAGSVDSVFGRAGVVVAVAGDYTASEVTNVPAGDIAATTVQAAITELDNEKQPLFIKILIPTGIAATDTANVNNAIIAANAANGGKILGFPGTFRLNASMLFKTYTDVSFEGFGDKTIIEFQAGGTWTDSAGVTFSSTNTGVINLSSFTKGDLSIFTSTAGNAAFFTAGMTIILKGADPTGLSDAMYVTAAANGNAGTGEITLTSRVMESMASPTALGIDGGRNCTLKNVTLDFTAVTDVSFLGISFVSSVFHNLENVYLKNLTPLSAKAISLSSSVGINLRDVDIYNTEEAALSMSDTLSCYFENINMDLVCTGGINGAVNMFNTACDNKFYNIRIKNCGGNGFGVGAATEIRRNYVDGLDLKRIASVGLFIRGARDCEFTGIEAFETAGDAVQLFADCINNKISGTFKRCSRSVGIYGSSNSNIIDVTSRFSLNGALEINNSHDNVINLASSNDFLGGFIENGATRNIVRGTVRSPNTNQPGFRIDDSFENDFSETIISDLTGTGVDFNQTGTSARNKLNRPSSVVKTANYTTKGEDIIYVDSTGGGFTITVSTADIVRVRLDKMIIKDIGGDLITNNVTIATEGAELIDGAATYVMAANYEFIELVSDNTNLYIIG